LNVGQASDSGEETACPGQIDLTNLEKGNFMNFLKKGRFVLLSLILLALFFWASGSWAATQIDNVRCVPWQGDPSKYHTAIGGQEALLKGVITASTVVQGNPITPYWHTDSDNIIRVVYSGGTYVSWVRMVIATGASTTTECVYDYNGGSCGEMNLCTAGYSATSFDNSVTIAASPVPDSIRLESINSCYTGNFAVYLNGSLVSTIATNPSGNCTCTPELQMTDLFSGEASVTIWYKWNFGDGTESAVQEVTANSPFTVEATHTYTAAQGTPFTAQLLVDPVDSSMANAVVDNYLVKVEEDALDFRVNRAIDNGLWYLYKNQLSGAESSNGQPVTAWSSYQSYHPSATGAAIQAFEINNHKATGNFNEDPYAEVVAAGLNWLLTGSFSGGTQILSAISLPAGNLPGEAGGVVPDGNSNGIGIQVLYPNDAPYQGGLVMDAIISSGTPGADSGRDFDGNGSTDTYQQVIQDMCDAYAWGQGDGAAGSGSGWSYNWNENRTDNSTNQWAVIGLIPAQNDFSCTVPQFVKDRQNASLTYTYNAGQRYFGYDSSTSLVSGTAAVTRPSGMVQMIFAVPSYQSDVRWTGPESWFAENFDSAFSTSQRSYYGWLSFVKSMILSGTELMSNGLNWYRGSDSLQGLAQRVVNDQEGDGSWPQGGQISYPGSYGDVFVTSWAIQMLKPALFQAAPIACFSASPNPTYADREISFNPACSDHSDSDKDINNLVLFEWDWDNDGVYDDSSAGPDVQTHSFGCVSLPCTFPVVLRVTDDEGIQATFSLDIRITNPPHPPEADAGGPYVVSLCDTDSLTLDGSNSFEPDEGTHESGCATCPDDLITAWDWDLAPPLNDFSDTSGETVTLNAATVSSYFSAGLQQQIGLRVTDNTALSYPGSAQPNLTAFDFTTVNVFNGCACDLTVEMGCESVILNWTEDGTYELLRSETGPNSGFVKLADVTGTTYTDTTPVSGVSYWYRLKGNDCMSSTGVITYVYDPSLCELPECISNLSAIAKERKVQLEWACQQDADGYNVYRNTSQDVALIPANKIADGFTSTYCAFTDRSVTNGITYYYKITKVVSGEEVCVSNEISATPVELVRTRR